MVAAFGEEPFGAGVDFSEGEEVGGDVGVIFWEMFFGNGELVHEGKAEVLLAGGEVDFVKCPREFSGRLPTDLAAEA